MQRMKNQNNAKTLEIIVKWNIKQHNTSVQADLLQEYS
jgi:hypothetical protein